MKNNIELTKESLIDYIKFREEEHNKIHELYKMGVDIIDVTESYNTIIDKQFKTMWGDNFYEWVWHYCLESKDGGYDSGTECSICYSVDSLYEYYRGEKYFIKQFQKDLKYYYWYFNNEYYVIEAVSDSIFNAIRRKFIKEDEYDGNYVLFTKKESLDETIKDIKVKRYTIKDYYNNIEEVK